MSASAPVPQRLLDSVDESPVVAYVKGLDGRYLHVNQRYQEFFEVGGDEVHGRTDDELAPQHTVDGPRRASGNVSADEPLQLEYTVAPFEGRSALAVWRFVIRSAANDTIAVCGVAAPVADAVLARRECERLMAVAQDAEEVEPQLAQEVDEPQGDGHRIAELHEASASAARRAHELLTELTAERERRAEAEAAVLAERARADEADRAAQREREGADAANETALAERSRAVKTVADLNAARAELASVRGRLEGVEANAQREAARAAEAEGAAQGERARVEEALAELNAVRGELASVRGRLEGAEAAAQRERARAEEVHAELEAAQADLASERLQRTHTEEEVIGELRRRLEEANAALEAERARAKEVRAELEAAHAEMASERERRTQTEEQVIGELRRRLEEADAALQAERARADEVRAELEAARAQLDAARADLESERAHRTHTEEGVIGELRGRLEVAAAALNANGAELDAVRAELASERDQHAQNEAEVVADLRAKLESAVAELNAARTQLETAETSELVDDLRRELEHAAASAQQERARADAAEATLNSERADAEIRLGVAERRIAELEASLGDARARELEVTSEHGGSGPRWDASAQRAFTTALTQSSDWRVSVKSAIAVIGSRGGWDAVCAWQPDDRNGFASCFAMWTGENRRLGALETATWQRRQPLTESTIGEALTWEESQWLAADPRAADRRLQLLAQHGIRGALIVPVKDGARPVAALELLTVGTTEPSRELTDAIETIALQLGHFSHLLSAGAQPRWHFGRV